MLAITVPASRAARRRSPRCPSPAVPAVPARRPRPVRCRSARGFELVAERRVRARTRRVAPAHRSRRRNRPRPRSPAGAACARSSSRVRRAFVQRRLPRRGDEAELAFDLNPRTFSSAGAWIEVAAITGASGQRLASVDLRSLRGGDQLRLSASTGTGAVLHSQPRVVRRRPTALVLSLDPAQAGLVVDGASSAGSRAPPDSPQPAASCSAPGGGPPARPATSTSTASRYAKRPRRPDAVARVCRRRPVRGARSLGSRPVGSVRAEPRGAFDGRGHMTRHEAKLHAAPAVGRLAPAVEVAFHRLGVAIVTVARRARRRAAGRRSASARRRRASAQRPRRPLRVHAPWTPP